MSLAISRGPVTVIRTMEGIQPVYILLISLALFPFYPKLFREVSEGKAAYKFALVSLIVPLKTDFGLPKPNLWYGEGGFLVPPIFGKHQLVGYCVLRDGSTFSSRTATVLNISKGKPRKDITPPPGPTPQSTSS